MDPDLNIPLKDRLGLTAWGVLCISGLYVCLYFTAYKQLRLWLAVRKVVKDRQDDIAELTQAAAPIPASSTSSSSTAAWSRYIPHLVKASAAAPVMAWAWRTYTLGAGFLDITLIAFCYFGMVIAICCVINLPYTDLAITSQAITKEKPKGWALVPTSPAFLSTIIQTNYVAFPITSILMCTWILTRDSPAGKALGDGAFIAMLCLGPIVGLRTIRAADIRMKHVFWIALAGLSFVAITIFTLAIITITSGPDRKPPPTEDTTDDGFIVWALSRVCTKALLDLCVLVRTAQIGAVLYYPVFALLRFEHDQAAGESGAEYTAVEQAEDTHDTGAHDGEEKSAESNTATAVESNTSKIVLIPTTVQPFPAPLFHTVLAGGFLGSVLATILFPQPEVWDLCTLGACLGMVIALGARLGTGGVEQRKALWLYNEVWAAKPLKQEEEA